jgi:hypothetical protein
MEEEVSHHQSTLLDAMLYHHHYHLIIHHFFGRIYDWEITLTKRYESGQVPDEVQLGGPWQYNSYFPAYNMRDHVYLLGAIRGAGLPTAGCKL